MKRAWIVLAACAVLAGGVCADELHLKDGSVVNGTIVGFDENSFKVKTNYGYAIVRRDQVVSIEVRDPDADAAKKPDPSAKPPAPSAPAPTSSTFPSANGAPATPPQARRPVAVVPPSSPKTTSAPPTKDRTVSAFQPSTEKPKPPANSSS